MGQADPNPDVTFGKTVAYLKSNDYRVLALRDLEPFVHPDLAPDDPMAIVRQRQRRMATRHLPPMRMLTLGKDSPWAVDSMFHYSLAASNAVDFEFQCVPRDVGRFGRRGYGVFFFAN